jgi:hypothetical protein
MVIGLAAAAAAVVVVVVAAVPGVAALVAIHLKTVII